MWTIDGSLFVVKAQHFERDLRQFSEDTYNKMIKDWIEKETKLNKFIQDKEIIQYNLNNPNKRKGADNRTKADIFSKVP